MNKISDAEKSARTSGDGMEFQELPKSEQSNICPNKEIHLTTKNTVPKTSAYQKKDFPIPGRDVIYRPSSDLPKSLPASLPKGKLYRLSPKLIVSNKVPKLRNREPKFVPFEPYKGAVNPIIPSKKYNRIKMNKNNLDINILVSQMSNLKTNELNSTSQNVENNINEKNEFETEREMYEKKLEKLQKEKDYVQSQLKFQVQVNSELKNLLVAAVGEDLQTRVNVLTEDKLQLARALLDSANHLSTHTEQIEFIAGQCEVWRSKFLASSVMVEELARWKADLTQKNTLLTDANKRMLQLTSQIREMLSDTLKNLKFIAKLRSLNLPSTNIIDLASECLNISQQIVLHSGIGMPDVNLNLNNLATLTDAENLSIQALENTSQPLMSTDEAFKAIVGQAFPTLEIFKNISKPIQEEIATMNDKNKT